MTVVLILILIMIGIGIIMNLGFNFFSWLFKSHFAPHSENQVLAIKQDAAEQEGILSRFTGGCKSLVTNIFSGSEEDKKIDEALKELQEAAEEYNKVMDEIANYLDQRYLELEKIHEKSEVTITELEPQLAAAEALAKELSAKLSTTEVVEHVVSEKEEIRKKQDRYRQEIAMTSREHCKMKKLLHLPDDFFLTIPMNYKCLREKAVYVRDRTRDLLEHHQITMEIDKSHTDSFLSYIEGVKHRLMPKKERVIFTTQRM
jgi:hypothetical protein